MNSSGENKDMIRRKVIGLGDDSLRKSYYPQLQEKITELKNQKQTLEQKTEELNQSIRDLQETKKLLENSENKFRQLFESANDAIFIFDRAKRCIDCNSKALDLLQCTNKKDLTSVDPYAMFPLFQPNGRTSFELLQKRVSRAWNGQLQRFEWVVLKKDNSKAYCQVALNSIEIGEQVILQAIVREVTEIKKLEHKIRMATIRTEERERLRFAKELHDGIGPILSTIKLYVQWLEETDNEDHIKVIKQKINSCITEATESLKEVSHNLSPHVLTNYGLIEALHIFIKRIKDTGKLNIRFKSNLEERLNSDLEIMFYRVTTELINNTLKHADATQVSIEFKLVNDLLHFYYSDNGKGLEKEILKDSKLTLGLYNIRNRVKSLGGSIEIKSAPNKGLNAQVAIINNHHF